MTRTKVEILRSQVSDGEAAAVIRLYDTWIVPRDATFRIEPLADEDLSEIDDWPRGDLQPVETRVTADGVELSIGFAVTDASSLLPGTPVVISVPAAGIREEVRWPNIPPSRSKARTATVMSGEQRLAVLKERARQAEIAAASAVADLPSLSELALPVSQPPNSGQFAVDANEPPPLATLETVRSARPVDLSVAADPESAVPKVDAQQGRDDRGSENDGLSALGDASPGVPKAPPIAMPRTPATTLADENSAIEVAPPGKGSPEASTAPVIAARPPVPARHPEPSTVSRSHSRPNMTRTSGAEKIDRAPRTGSVSFLLGALTVALVGAGLWVMKPQLLSGWKTHDVVAPQPVSPQPALPSVKSIAALIDVPNVSPRGVTADGVSFAEALRRADGFLHEGRSKEERLEASYWLRKALALGFGDKRTAWALSQLGTLLAAPDVTDPPDLDGARALWGLAASGGDPMSACFIAALHEHGNAGPKDPGLALSYYLKAKDLGGCPGIDAAIARLKKGAP